MTTLTPFEADMERFDTAFRAADAIRTEPDGFTWLDVAKVPAALVRSFQLLVQYGYATGRL